MRASTAGVTPIYGLLTVNRSTPSTRVGRGVVSKMVFCPLVLMVILNSPLMLRGQNYYAIPPFCFVDFNPCVLLASINIPFLRVMRCGAAEATGLGFVVLLLSTLVWCQPTELILGLFCFINVPILPPPQANQGRKRNHEAHGQILSQGERNTIQRHFDSEVGGLLCQ